MSNASFPLSMTTTVALTAIMALVLALGLSAPEAQAENYPNRPITVIVPAPAGGGTEPRPESSRQN